MIDRRGSDRADIEVRTYPARAGEREQLMALTREFPINARARDAR